MPEFPIVDAHVHLYDPAAISYPWMSQAPSLNKPHLPQDYLARTGGVVVDGIVFVEVDAAPGRHLDEARWVDNLAKGEPRVRGMVASIPLECGPSVEPDLAALAELGVARGVRRLIQGHVKESGWALRDPFVAALRLLPRYRLTFDLCIYHPQLVEVTELVRRCPEVTFVLDHIGKPGIRDGLTAPWQAELRALARLPNVMCKISGAVTEADHAAWREAAVAPYVAHAIECFGFDRVMFGGDWPVVELAGSYRRWVDLVDSVVAGSTPEERRKLYRDNATAFYRL
jgi:L-fuconolactonase